MDIISEINKSISLKLDSIVYTNKPKTWKVNNVLTIDWKGILPDPPKNTSEQTKKELAYLEKITNNLSYEDKNLINLVDKDPIDLYKPIFNKIGQPVPKEDLEKVWKISKSVILNLKHKFNRPRPKQLSEALNFKIEVVETKTHQTPAYPSGHTAYAALGAYLFADMYPNYSSEFFKMINLAGLARCLQGVHYPSDNEAAMVISGAIWQDVRYKLFPNLQIHRSR